MFSVVLGRGCRCGYLDLRGVLAVLAVALAGIFGFALGAAFAFALDERFLPVVVAPPCNAFTLARKVDGSQA
jgi:hypothetical protein